LTIRSIKKRGENRPEALPDFLATFDEARQIAKSQGEDDEGGNNPTNHGKIVRQHIDDGSADSAQPGCDSGGQINHVKPFLINYPTST